MDSLVDFSPMDTSMFQSHFTNLSPPPYESALVSILLGGPLLTGISNSAGFINVNAIRLKKYGMQKVEEGQSLSTV